MLKGTHVFYYHGIVEKKTDAILERNFHTVSEFREELTRLKKSKVISLGELEIEPGVIITFDDGHQNMLLAAELCAEFRVPWSLFVSVGGLGFEGCLWPTEVTLLILHGTADELESLGKTWSLRGEENRLVAFRFLLRQMKRMSAENKNRELTTIRGQFPKAETQRLIEKFPSQRMLTWDEVKQLSQAGVEIGSHGVTHEIHHDGQSVSTKKTELTESKRILERKLGLPCPWFAFPNGDTNARSVQDLHEAGYTHGLTTEPLPFSKGPLVPRFNPMDLRS